MSALNAAMALAAMGLVGAGAVVVVSPTLAKAWLLVWLTPAAYLLITSVLAALVNG